MTVVTQTVDYGAMNMKEAASKNRLIGVTGDQSCREGRQIQISHHINKIFTFKLRVA
jgi:hypothetical protein